MTGGTELSTSGPVGSAQPLETNALPTAPGIPLHGCRAPTLRRSSPISNLPSPATVVVGDVDSTVACGLAAAKFGVQIVHFEASLRSFDRSIPGEINRLVTDAIADLLLTRPGTLLRICNVKVFPTTECYSLALS